ncbi:hypothetical protein F4809DRAFT_560083 [Biscogniauxia mediterranea]|nr:hypothetical protein F4809DRAFT_560083 [Biscogniauxia mediterranea]
MRCRELRLLVPHTTARLLAGRMAVQWNPHSLLWRLILCCLSDSDFDLSLPFFFSLSPFSWLLVPFFFFQFAFERSIRIFHFQHCLASICSDRVEKFIHRSASLFYHSYGFPCGSASGSIPFYFTIVFWFEMPLHRFLC